MANMRQSLNLLRSQAEPGNELSFESQLLMLRLCCCEVTVERGLVASRALALEHHRETPAMTYLRAIGVGSMNRVAQVNEDVVRLGHDRHLLGDVVCRVI